MKEKIKLRRLTSYYDRETNFGKQDLVLGDVVFDMNTEDSIVFLNKKSGGSNFKVLTVREMEQGFFEVEKRRLTD